ncbi:MAG: DUF262 domain-containing protein, partial [Planctomycetota bacterium]
MAASNFSARSDTFRKLLGNGLTYCVPPFQSDYSWGEDQWSDLWSDLLGTFGEDAEPAHYLGYLVLQSADDKSFDVIDGQQRLTTISILVLAVMKALKRLVEAGVDAGPNQQRLDQIRSSYIGFLDPVTLVARPKLTLNRNNNGYWQNHMVPLLPLPSRGFRASEVLLRRAFEWFDARVSERFENVPERGKELARFLEHASDKFFFTVVTVTDELNAYKVFETLNARGVRLSTTDLLKNWLFSLLGRQQTSEHEIANLQDRWESMVGRLGAESFPEFLRVHWNSRHAFVREANLFKAIRSSIRDREGVFETLRQMEEDLDHYLALVSPDQSAWPTEVKEDARLLQSFQVTRPYSMLLAACRRFSGPEFAQILRACVIVSLRYNVICGFSTGEQEQAYSEIASGIANAETTTVNAVLEGLRPIYPSDATFRGAFTEKSIRTRQSRNVKLVRYLLASIERHVGGKSHVDADSGSVTLEHVLPQNPGAAWGP